MRDIAMAQLKIRVEHMNLVITLRFLMGKIVILSKKDMYLRDGSFSEMKMKLSIGRAHLLL